MTRPETYSAELRDRVSGPIIETLHDQPLVDRRPARVIRRHVEHDGERRVKVYDLEHERGERHRFSYLLSYEGPDEVASDPDVAGAG